MEEAGEAGEAAILVIVTEYPAGWPVVGLAAVGGGVVEEAAEVAILVMVMEYPAGWLVVGLAVVGAERVAKADPADDRPPVDRSAANRPPLGRCED